MTTFFSGRNNGTSPQALIETDEGREFAVCFQDDNQSNGRNGQASRSLAEFVGVKTGVAAAKIILTILLVIFLLNVVITFVNWRSMSIASSTAVEKMHLEETNANFSRQLEKIRTELKSDLRNFTGKTTKELGEQKRRLDTSQHNSRVSSNLTQGKIQDLEQQLQNLDEHVKDVFSNYDGANSKLSSDVSSNKGNISYLHEIIDNLYRQIEIHSQSGNGTEIPWSSGNYTPETRPRLEFVQEIWKEGKMGVVLSEEISPQQNLKNRIEKLKSKIQSLKTLPSRMNLEDRKVLFDLLYNSSEIRMERTDVCSGSFNFSSPTFFRYEQSLENTAGQPCVWVISTGGVSTAAIKVQLVDLNGELRIYTGFSAANTNYAVQNWTRADLFGETIVNSTIFIAVFTPSPHASSSVMEIGLRTGVQAASVVHVSVTKLTATSTSRTLTSSTSPYSSVYDDNQRRFYILYPTSGEKVRIAVQRFKTEANHDYLQLFKYDNSSREFTFIRKYTGVVSPYGLNVNYDGIRNQPMLMYFHTDVSTVSEGFSASVQSLPV